METTIEKLRCKDCRKFTSNSRACDAGKLPHDDDPVCSDAFEPKAWGKVKTLPQQPSGKTARYLETKMISLSLLDKHPDAEAFGADVEDRVALSSSVSDVGLLDPISVMENGERYLILDGCGRFDAIAEAGGTEAMCTVFELEGLSPREFAMQRNTMGRKVTTGQRLMCYLSLNQAAVLEASDSATAGRHSKSVSRETNYTTAGIAARLGVSKNDVMAGIDLLKTRDDAVNNDGNVLATGEVYSAVMDGRLPIRRWKPAYEGKIKTKGMAKAETNYVNLATRTLTSLGTVFENWQEIPLSAREPILDKLDDLMSTSPEDVRVLLVNRYQLPAKKKAN